MKNKMKQQLFTYIGVLIVSVLLGIFTTYSYVDDYQKAEHFNFEQLNRHKNILEGQAGNPWQYRVLAPYLMVYVLKGFAHFRIPEYISVSFISFRIVQDSIIFLLSFLYYKKLGLSIKQALIGLAILAWGISYSSYDSDLQLNTFFDIIFYLSAGLLILHRKYIWIIPLIVLAALNRETSGLIPFMLLFVAIFALPKGTYRQVLSIFITASAIYAVIFVGLRLYYGEQKLFIPYGNHPGLELLQYNLFRLETWRQLFATLSIIPFVALIAFKKWPVHLQVYFWAIVPVWFTVHAFGAVMAEARLFLVPQALIFIPATLLVVRSKTDSNKEIKINP